MPAKMKSQLSFEKLSSPDPKIKFGFAKFISQLAGEDPRQLYSSLPQISKLLKQDNQILKWTGIDLIGLLSSVDEANKISGYLPSLISELHGGKLITANHACAALCRIAQNKPRLRKKILAEIYRLPEVDFESLECREIACGKSLDYLAPLLPEIQQDAGFIALLNRCARSSRNATRKRAEKILKKNQKSGKLK